MPIGPSPLLESNNPTNEQGRSGRFELNFLRARVLYKFRASQNSRWPQRGVDVCFVGPAFASIPNEGVFPG
jgi:hypothetical protein